MSSTSQHDLTRTRLSGRVLNLARLAWVLVAILAIVLLTMGLPSYYAEKAQVCTRTIQECDRLNLTNPSAAQTLERAGLPVPTYARLVLAFRLVSTMLWAAMGVLIFLRRSDDWMALLVSALLLLFDTANLRMFTAQHYPALALLTQVGFSLQNMLLMLFVALFPAGRFSPRFLAPYWIFTTLISLAPESVFSSLRPELFVFYAVIVWGTFLLIGPATLIYRYKRVLSPLERQQTKWVIAGFTGMAALILLSFFLINAGGLARVLIDDFYFDLASMLLPISLVFSVLRYRLWDIDVLIRRTLIYGTLSLALGALYLGGVVLVQSIFDTVTKENTPAIVVSTLLIAALFNPLRVRIQAGIDRRFYRRSYDAQKALENFASTARSDVDLDGLSQHLVQTVRETMQPAHTSLWLAKTSGRRGTVEDDFRPAA